MNAKIALLGLLAIVSCTTLVFALDCYQCGSSTGIDESCLDEYTPKDSHVVTCTMKLAQDNLKAMKEQFGGKSKDNFSMLKQNQTTTLANEFVCVKAKAEKDGVQAVARGCGIPNPDITKDTCEKDTVEGIKAEACVCFGDKCNSGTYLTGTITTVLTMAIFSFKCLF